MGNIDDGEFGDGVATRGVEVGFLQLLVLAYISIVTHSSHVLLSYRTNTLLLPN